MQAQLNRRSMLGMSMVTAAGFYVSSARVFGQSSSPGTTMDALSAYMSAAANRALPADVAEHAKHHLLDTLAAMISGSQLLPGQAALRYIRAHAGKGDGDDRWLGAHGRGRRRRARQRRDGACGRDRRLAQCLALASGLRGRARGARGRRGAWHRRRALPARGDARLRHRHARGHGHGRRRIQLRQQPEPRTASPARSAPRPLRPAPPVSTRGRCAGRSTTRRSSPPGIVAWRRDTDHIEKAFVFAGMPARNGVTSALLVRSGWNGVDDIFSGADNFFLAYAPKAQPERLVEKLGERYEIAQTDIKKWTVGSPIQGPLDAIEAIRGKQPFEADQVQSVTVRLAPSVAAVVDNRDIPDICLQHMIAVMLIDKTVSFHAAHDKPRMQDAGRAAPARESESRARRGARQAPAGARHRRRDRAQGRNPPLGARRSRARHAAQPDVARRGDRQGTGSHRAGAGARNIRSG